MDQIVRVHENRTRNREMTMFRVTKLRECAPVFIWDRHVEIQQEAIQQAEDLSRLPFVKRVCLMPDAHWGMGAAIGSVIATKGAVIPSAVGVDIGCGMAAMQLKGWKSFDLVDKTRKLREAIERAVPTGFSTHRKSDRYFEWQGNKQRFEWLEQFIAAWPGVMGKRKKTLRNIVGRQFGTMGGGNHFLEVCVDQYENVWLMVHSGSRGIGNMIGTYFIRRAKELCERRFIKLINPHLGYFADVDVEYYSYIEAAGWAQAYAWENRLQMLQLALEAVSEVVHEPYDTETIHCHHNYLALENHGGKNILVTRKGAVRARKHDEVIIPGSMGAKSYLCEGKGNEKSLMSCSHGAGRAMSRTAAKKAFTVEDHEKATEGVECRKDASVLDETPQAYKDIDAVMQSQEDLVRYTYILRQKVCVKG